VSVATENDIDSLRAKLNEARAESIPEILHGEAGLVAVASLDGVDTVVSATVGAVGFTPTYKALQLGRRVCLANKETLVMAGGVMTRDAPGVGVGLFVGERATNAVHPLFHGGERPGAKLRGTSLDL